MITLLAYTDPHCCDTPPESRLDDIFETLHNKYSMLRQLAKAQNADAIVCAGDFFNVKAATQNSHHLVRWLISEINAFGIPHIGIPGNHDMSHNRLESLKKQPYGTLVESGCLWDCSAKPFDIVKGTQKFRIIGLPYINSDIYPYLSGLPRELPFMLLLHTYVAAKGGRFFEETVYSASDIVTASGAQIVFSGHYHGDWGTYQVGNSWVSSPGALYRGSISEENITRKVQVVLFKIHFDSIEAIPIQLSVRPSEEVFDLTRKEKNATTKIEIENYIKQLSQISTVNKGAVLLDRINQFNLEPDIHERVLFYLRGTGLVI